MRGNLRVCRILYFVDHSSPSYCDRLWGNERQVSHRRSSAFHYYPALGAEGTQLSIHILAAMADGLN